VALADGSVFRGTAVGAGGIVTGEIVFNTSMTGYQEIITDPSYAGQIITFTAPHIGNYGTSPLDDQADTIHARGLVMRQLSGVASSWRTCEPLEEYLATRGVVAVTDVDTRRLTRHIRARGAMSAAIGSDVDISDLIEAARATPPMSGRDLASTVTTKQAYHCPANGSPIGHVVAYDFGIKRDIVAAMRARGLAVTVVPASTSSTDVLALAPDGVFLSSGPGDPEPLVGPIEAVRGLLGRIPVFGVCLGHQVLGLALGAETFKLPFGHHGGNQPVVCVEYGTVAITAHNHGFAVDLWSLAGKDQPRCEGLPTSNQAPMGVDSRFGLVDSSHMNLNDGTNEGLACREIDAFSVQYHPEAAPGPNDAAVHFDQFASLIGGDRAAAT